MDLHCSFICECVKFKYDFDSQCKIFQGAQKEITSQTD